MSLNLIVIILTASPAANTALKVAIGATEPPDSGGSHVGQICDRSGLTAQMIRKFSCWRKSMNCTTYDMAKTAGEGQSFYSTFAASNVSMYDNYGYATDDMTTGAPDPDFLHSYAPIHEKQGKSMYHFMITDGVGDIRGKKVLEVGSGRGKGAAYIAQHFNPAHYVGVDLNQARVDISSRAWSHIPNLEFMVGDAMDLPFPRDHFEVALNVESSFHYPNFEKFVAEVYRVLKPGGIFLWTAPLLHEGDNATNKEQQFARAGFSIRRKMDITANVIKARDAVAQGAPASEMNLWCSNLYPIFAGTLSPYDAIWEFAAMPGSLIYDSMNSGQAPYLRFVAEKPAEKS